MELANSHVDPAQIQSEPRAAPFNFLPWQKAFRSVLSNTVATDHMWLLSTEIWQVQLGFCFWNMYFISTNVKLNRHMYLVSTGRHARRGSYSQSGVFRAAAWCGRNANSQAPSQMHWIRSSVRQEPARWSWQALQVVLTYPHVCENGIRAIQNVWGHTFQMNCTKELLECNGVFYKSRDWRTINNRCPAQ